MCKDELIIDKLKQDFNIEIVDNSALFIILKIYQYFSGYSKIEKNFINYLNTHPDYSIIFERLFLLSYIYIRKETA